MGERLVSSVVDKPSAESELGPAVYKERKQRSVLASIDHGVGPLGFVGEHGGWPVE